MPGVQSPSFPRSQGVGTGLGPISQMHPLPTESGFRAGKSRGHIDPTRVGRWWRGQSDLFLKKRWQPWWSWQHPSPTGVVQTTVSVLGGGREGAKGVLSPAQQRGMLRSLVPLCKASRPGSPALPEC